MGLEVSVNWPKAPKPFSEPSKKDLYILQDFNPSLNHTTTKSATRAFCCSHLKETTGGEFRVYRASITLL